MHSSFLALIALCFALPAAAQDDRAELLGLAAQRATIEAQFKAESDICSRRFFVNACLDETKARRNAGLKPLLEREALLDLNERRARAEAQRERVAERERELAAAEGRHRTAELMHPAASSAPLVPRLRAGSAPKSKATQSTLQEQEAKAAMALDEAQRRHAQKANYQSEQLRRQKDDEQRQHIAEAKLKGKKAPMALPIPSAAEIEAAGSTASGTKR